MHVFAFVCVVLVVVASDVFVAEAVLVGGRREGGIAWGVGAHASSFVGNEC